MDEVDIFTVQFIEEKKFDFVSRIGARSEKLELFMLLDVNTEVYPVKEGDKFSVLITVTLNLDGSAETGYYNPNKQASVADDYEYVMQGKLYKIEEVGEGAHEKVEVLISFGGLLLSLKGQPSYFTKFELDQRYFICMRKLV
ncbi:hypothetical protein Tsubulata_007377 [Turnera subulata]|uniref:DNA-directed RNA polymerases I, II, and III subunit RPABC3 n=1 Tax=Turnera subulata TaxID=218843 RepID=A0A9Q0J458_9ROSI|nr:hypothetical protein Tsubulata_007377 [Turnera subulata]